MLNMPKNYGGCIKNYVKLRRHDKIFSLSACFCRTTLYGTLVDIKILYLGPILRV